MINYRGFSVLFEDSGEGLVYVHIFDPLGEVDEIQVFSFIDRVRYIQEIKKTIDEQLSD